MWYTCSMFQFWILLTFQLVRLLYSPCLSQLLSRERESYRVLMMNEPTIQRHLLYIVYNVYNVMVSSGNTSRLLYSKSLIQIPRHFKFYKRGESVGRLTPIFSPCFSINIAGAVNLRRVGPPASGRSIHSPHPGPGLTITDDRNRFLLYELIFVCLLFVRVMRRKYFRNFF